METTLGTVGSIHLKARDSLANLHAKGYLLILAADLEMDGLDRLWGRKRRGGPAGTVTPVASSMAGDVEVTSTRG